MPTFGFVIDNQEHHFRLAVPDGFRRTERLMEDARIDGDELYHFGRDASPGRLIGERFGVKVLAREIAREPMTKEGAQERLCDSSRPLMSCLDGVTYTERWKDLELSVMSAKLMWSEGPAVKYRVEVPLKGKALALVVVCDRQDDEAAQRLLRQLLDGLDGESSWLTDAQISDERRRVAFNRVLLMAVVVSTIALAECVRRRVFQTRRPTS